MKSNIAVEINISIMRTFVAIRKFASEYVELSNKIDELELKFASPVRTFRLGSRNIPSTEFFDG